jgi:hypothetical protein
MIACFNKFNHLRKKKNAFLSQRSVNSHSGNREVYGSGVPFGGGGVHLAPPHNAQVLTKLSPIPSSVENIN